MALRSALVLAGVLAGTGTVVGLTHATPKLLQASGVTCKPIGNIVDTQRVSESGTKRYIKRGRNQWSKFPWDGAKAKNQDSAKNCYKW